MKSSFRTVFELSALLAGAALLLLFLRPNTTTRVTAPQTKAEWVQSVKDLTKQKTGHESLFKYTSYQPEKSYQGFTMYPESGTARVYLVNMTGNVMNTWKFDGERVRLLPNCNVMTLHGTKWGLGVEPWRSLRNVIREYDWEGNLVWEFRQKGPIHHDIALLDNGNIIGMQRIEVPRDYQQSAEIPFFRSIRVRSDELFEITRDGQQVWSWRFHEHKPLNTCGRFACEPPPEWVLDGRKQYDWTHMNTVGVIPENQWYASGDKRFKPGNIIIMPRNFSTTMIVDRENGAIVWEYTGNYKGGLSYGHEAHMIPPGLPGAGNILIFDNGEGREESYILELNPVTQEPVWVYDAGKDFFSKVAGAVQRLPNGNTLISEDVRGRVFEVTPNKEVVWTYEGNKIRSARAHRYAQNHCPRLAELPLHD